MSNKTKDKMEGKKSEDRKYTTITIPKPLFEKLEKIIANTGFSSVSDYVTYLLRNHVSEINQIHTKKEKAQAKEHDAIIERLKSLGYL